MAIESYRCPNCGTPISYTDKDKTCHCEACFTEFLIDGGNAVHVIDEPVRVVADKKTKFLDIFLWFLPIPLFIGLIRLGMKASIKRYFMQLSQRINRDASTIDNFQANRVVILQNTARLLEKSISLDKDTFAQVSALRSGINMNQMQSSLDLAQKSLDAVVEAYPELKAHDDIMEAMRQNSYLQQEITAAREVYNDSVHRWNMELFMSGTKQLVAEKEGLTTKIPFIASREIKAKAEGVFF